MHTKLWKVKELNSHFASLQKAFWGVALKSWKQTKQINERVELGGLVGVLGILGNDK